MDMQNRPHKGVYLQQFKEPALSREIRTFLNASASETLIEHPATKELDDLTAWEIVDIARQAGIVDERDGRPLYQKLQRARDKEIRAVVIDAMDDEPFVSSQLGVLLHMRDSVSFGLKAVRKAVEAESSVIAVYKNLTDAETRIPGSIDGVRVARIGGKYPAELHLSRELGLRKAYITVGVCALVFLARAIISGQMQKSCFITVAGNCIANPTNLEVSLGMNLSMVLERCGLADNPTRVVIGGSMTGISIMDTDKTLISPTTRAVLAFREDEKERNYTCIGCGRCTAVCPQDLDPMFIYRAVKNRRLSMLGFLKAEKCVGCGTCSYVCPSKLPLSTVISKYSKPDGEEDEACN
ncbi:MAG: 4Fe-4S dicluster domain-containing protein [Oscillospiraceae bacterium]|nr:4Fe-4S dicluster domain-containing protein [Oscillospiraceae bacterium]